MIQIFPTIEFQHSSPYGGELLPKKILWQGMHTCVETECSSTQQTVIADLPVSHAVTNACQVNIKTGEIFCRAEVKKWLGIPLLQSLQNPDTAEIELTIEKKKEYKSVVIINCLDHLYGHALLKLLNVERHLDTKNKLGVIVLIQDFLRWLVPDGVAEIWTVKIPLNKAQNYFPKVQYAIEKECKRFKIIYVSKAYSHPTIKDISRFSRIQKHSAEQKDFRISFIWRSDRPWIDNPYLIAAAKKTGLMRILHHVQKRKIIRLFTLLRKYFPENKFTVTGFGTAIRFPRWIDDQRVNGFSEEIEKKLCNLYAQSRIVIGIHGSNMLLPSAHAGMTVDLMPTERWGNFAQDILFQEENIRLAVFRYRFFPLSTSLAVLAHSIQVQIREFQYFMKQMSV